MNAFVALPDAFNWTPEQLAGAVPLRLSEAALFDAASQHGDLAAIYNIGGGAEGIGRALKEVGADRKLVFIGHGLTPDTRALLIDGTMDAVITQNPQGAVMNCVRIFANLRDGREATSGVETTRSQVIFRENLP